MARYPKSALLPNLAALALCGLNRHRDAIPLFHKAIQLDPDFNDARRNLAQTLIVIDQPDKALIVLDRLVAAQPVDEAAEYLRAQALLRLGRLDAAEAAANRAIALSPRQARIYNLRGVLRERLGLIEAALSDFTAALEIDPDNVETLINISQPLARQTRHAEALSTIRRAVELAPTHIQARLRLAATYTEAGQTEAAQAEYREILAHAPQNAEAIMKLAALQGPATNADLLPAARAALKRTPARSPDRVMLNFALARLTEQAGETAAAARHLTDANREMARARPYDAAADSALNRAIMARFPMAVPEPAPGSDPVTPIYVLGLPRSGTTLTEAILSAHPQVAGLGEQITVGRFFFPLIEAKHPIGPEEFATFRDTEYRLRPQLPAGTEAFVDKMPENYRLIGFLKAAHPGAHIVHLRRDPRDVALSMWRGQFAGSALNYTYDLRAMAHRFNLYAEIMAFWRDLFPGEILDLSYEEITADVENASRRLALYCGLDWVPQMARPHETQTAILTASATQLRRPVHQFSVGKWRKHAEMLAPFIAGLDPALWPDLSN